MAAQISTSIHIAASPATVWNVLTDFNRYAEWNPFITSFEGTVAVGKRIRVRLEPPGGKGMTFQPIVRRFEQEKALSWLGRLFLPGIFDGEHTFELVAQPDGTTQFIQRETFRGILVPFLKKMLNGPTKSGFNEMNASLKAACER